MSNRFIPNSFQMPNAIIDEYLAHISGNAFKCYALIARQTTGWQKQSDKISVSQFMDKCNIKDPKTAYKVLAELEDIGLIIAFKKQGEITEFSLNFDFAPPTKKPLGKNGSTTKNSVEPLGKNGSTTKNSVEPLGKNGSTTPTKNPHPTKDTIKNNITNNPLNPPMGETNPAEVVLNYLNSALVALAEQLGERKPIGYSLKPWEKNILARVRESSVADCQRVVDYLVAKWGRDGKMREYLCPKTIFRANNFADYLPKSIAWEHNARPVCVFGKWMTEAQATQKAIMPTIDEVKQAFTRYLSMRNNAFRDLDFSNPKNKILYHAVIGTKNKNPLERDLSRVIAEQIQINVERIETLKIPEFN